MKKILGVVKHVISLTVILLIIIQTYYLNSANTPLPSKEFLIGGWFITHFAAILLRAVPCRLSLTELAPGREKEATVDKDFWSIIYFVLTPDYFWATYNKNLLAAKTGCNRQSRAEFVKYSNWINLSFAAFLYIVLTLHEAFMSRSQTVAAFSTVILQSFLIIRLFSRGLEMTIAFYRDVATHVPSVKSSRLSKYQRISLAVHSYFEIIIAYAISYYVLDFPLNFDKESDFTLSLLDSLYFSLGVVTFTNVNITGFNNLHKLIVYAQVFTAQVLIGLSIASYIGWQEEKEK